MIVFFKILQVILALSLLIIVHEAGHFLFAKLFHIRVEKFYLFFDVGGKALLKFKKGDTEFGIGWLPFGGYCKIAGMVDESMDMESLKKEPQSWEFRTHPAWQRLLVMAGGVLFNFIFAILTYSLISGIWGSAYLPNREAQIYPNELAQDMGFRAGDHIISLDDYQPQDFSNLQANLIRRQTQKVTVLRDADTLNL
ncbi:MAG: site-2 protease family protein, partial [Candidatus Cryptobacteroides sp.]